MANTFNGIGTTFYGQSRFARDGSFVTTKWFVLGFVPLFPMSSMRVEYLGTEGVPFFSRTASYEVIEELPLDGLQVVKTWAYAFLIVALFVAMMESQMPPVMKGLGIAAGVFLPHALRWFAKKQAGVA
jgi:hypothetical protein